ncbi:ABC transporter substrate-binding protein [Nocardioides baekrokdamisoli]|uniref:ABC transporter substrate-binding protein n=2 Tax=Nocardioides baekrokdamisoli TaxID=1804624 RepID=A0A3G9J4Q6_9ACTN|nr:ABC transporter substrate-binding protein [Nocardioides baekrokdamisoli]
MLSNIIHDTKAEHRRLQVAGVAFLTAMGLLIALSIAIYDKVFVSSTDVTVLASRAGLQLPKFGDVRMHGVIVGQIRSVTDDGSEAVIKLALDPKFTSGIPSNVSVKIVPTTLFGQKYVQFVDPVGVRDSAIADGAVIPASRVTTSVELESVLANLFPLLKSIKPSDLDVTLHAISSALLGRGDEIGQTLSNLNSYLATFNPHLPTMEADLAQLAKVAKVYGLAAPDLVNILRNATTTATTVAQQSGQLDTLFNDLTTLSNDGTSFLNANGQSLITEAAVAHPLLSLLDVYSPEYTCLLQGLDRYSPRLNQIFEHSRVSQTMLLSGTQQTAFTSSERPVYGDVGHGPWCYGLPYPKEGPGQPHLRINDGVSHARHP